MTEERKMEARKAEASETKYPDESRHEGEFVVPPFHKPELQKAAPARKRRDPRVGMIVRIYDDELGSQVKLYQWKGQWRIADRGTMNGVSIKGHKAKEFALNRNVEALADRFRIVFDFPPATARTILAEEEPPRTDQLSAAASAAPAQPAVTQPASGSRAAAPGSVTSGACDLELVDFDDPASLATTTAPMAKPSRTIPEPAEPVLSPEARLFARSLPEGPSAKADLSAGALAKADETYDHKKKLLVGVACIVAGAFAFFGFLLFAGGPANTASAIPAAVSAPAAAEEENPYVGLIRGGLEAFRSGEYEYAARQLRRATRQAPNSESGQLATKLHQALQLFADGQDPLRFDWPGAEKLLAEAVAQSQLPKSLKPLVSERLEWVRAEIQCATTILEATREEKNDPQRSAELMIELEQRYPKSDLVSLYRPKIHDLRYTVLRGRLDRIKEEIATRPLSRTGKWGLSHWKEAIGELEGIRTLVSDPQSPFLAEIDNEIASCRLNAEVFRVIENSWNLYREKKIERALEALNDARSGSLYDPLISNARDLFGATKIHAESLAHYDGGNGRYATTLLSGAPKGDSPTYRKMQEDRSRIQSVVSAYEKGLSAYQKDRLVDAVKAFREVAELESNPRNTYRRQAGEMLSSAQRQLEEVCQRAYDRFSGAFGKEMFAMMTGPLEELRAHDLDRTWEPKVGALFTARAGELCAKLQAKFWTGKAGDEDQVLIQELLRNLPADHPQRQKVEKLAAGRK